MVAGGYVLAKAARFHQNTRALKNMKRVLQYYMYFHSKKNKGLMSHCFNLQGPANLRHCGKGGLFMDSVLLYCM